MKPFCRSNFSWPRCSGEGCGKPKYLICQINISDLPDEVKIHIGKDSGLFQCFLCSSGCGFDKGRPSKGEYEDASVRIIPRKEMIPNLQTLTAIALYENKVETDKLPDKLKKFFEQINEKFGDIQVAYHARAQDVEENQNTKLVKM